MSDVGDLERQLTDTVVMVTPDQFRWEAAAAEDNRYMKRPEELNPPIAAEDVPVLALREFREAVSTLEAHGVSVLALRSPWKEDTPDAVFPNNWFSHHADGKLVLYPMKNIHRRNERQLQLLLIALNEAEIPVRQLIDLSHHEQKSEVLEGTGSLVLDRVKRVAFAIESERTSNRMFEMWCQRMRYKPVFFHAVDEDKDHYPIYHTNVVMTIGEGFAVICPETITNADERAVVLQQLADLDKDVITITPQQLRAYCANLLQLRTSGDGRVIVLSRSALEMLAPDQKQRLERYGDIVAITIPVIEGVGGGSARCMLAEAFRQ